MAESRSNLVEYEVDEFDCIGGRCGELGAGGFGVVHLASHRVLGNVALKCFPVTGGDHEKERVARDIQNELEMLQEANHKHILRVHGWTQWHGSMALILEYMPGGNLERLIRDPRIEPSPVLRLRICHDIAKALAFIHNLKKKNCLTHGDVKPGNVLLTEDLHCKLGDFGSAKVAKRTGVTSTTGSGQLSSELTLVYAAPERLKGPTKPKKAHDTYSFGLIVHMALTREDPHEDFTNVDQYLAAVKDGGRPLKDTIDELKESLSSDRDRKIIETLESVMERCWDQTPSQRPDMLDIRDELQEVMSEINHAETLQSVAAAISYMKIFIPTKSSELFPLKSFNTRERIFNKGKIEQMSVQRDVFQTAPLDPEVLLKEAPKQIESDVLTSGSESSKSSTQVNSSSDNRTGKKKDTNILPESGSTQMHSPFKKSDLVSNGQIHKLEIQESPTKRNPTKSSGDLLRSARDLKHTKNTETILVVPQLGIRVGRRIETEKKANEIEAGTVVKASFGSSFDVLWDKGEKQTLLVGRKAQPIVILDCAPAGIEHSHIRCDTCPKLKNQVKGARWKCKECSDFDLCTRCYMNNKHDTSHRFIRFDKENLNGYCVPNRSSSMAVQSVGLFPGAIVQRGPDWKWDKQDGGSGNMGQILSLDDRSDEVPCGIVNVRWSSNGSNNYRVGIKGKVDLKCVNAAKGLSYYWDHLQKCSVEAKEPRPIFGHQQKVTVAVPVKLLKPLVEKNREWNAGMAEFVGKDGTVVGYMANNDVVVEFHPLTLGRVSAGQRFVWIFPPSALKKSTSTSSLPSQSSELETLMQLMSPSTTRGRIRRRNRHGLLGMGDFGNTRMTSLFDEDDDEITLSPFLRW